MRPCDLWASWGGQNPDLRDADEIAQRFVASERLMFSEILSEQTVTLRAHVVRRWCISSGAAGARMLYGIGLAFTDEGYASASAVGELMAALDAYQILRSTPA